jgi:hypothetical protein
MINFSLNEDISFVESIKSCVHCFLSSTGDARTTRVMIGALSRDSCVGRRMAVRVRKTVRVRDPRHASCHRKRRRSHERTESIRQRLRQPRVWQRIRLVMINMCVNYGNLLLRLPVIKWISIILFIHYIRVTKDRCVSYICPRRGMCSYSLSSVSCPSIL